MYEEGAFQKLMEQERQRGRENTCRICKRKKLFHDSPHDPEVNHPFVSSTLPTIRVMATELKPGDVVISPHIDGDGFWVVVYRGDRRDG